MPNLSEIHPIKIGTILGYECFIPDFYNNPLGFLKRGCLIWIKVDEEGECAIMTIDGNNAFEEIGVYIKNHLEKKNGYRYKRVLMNDVLPISCQILNENDTVCAEIRVSNDYIVKSIKLGDSVANDYLCDYFLCDYNICGYESKILRFDKAIATEAKQLFHLLKDKNGVFIQLG